MTLARRRRTSLLQHSLAEKALRWVRSKSGASPALLLLRMRELSWSRSRTYWLSRRSGYESLSFVLDEIAPDAVRRLITAHSDGC